MPGAKMGLVDYISKNLFANAKQESKYNQHFVVATIIKIRDSFKHLIKNRLQTEKKLNSILKLHSPPYPSNKLIAPQMPTSQ